MFSLGKTYQYNIIKEMVVLRLTMDAVFYSDTSNKLILRSSSFFRAFSNYALGLLVSFDQKFLSQVLEKRPIHVLRPYLRLLISFASNR